MIQFLGTSSRRIALVLFLIFYGELVADAAYRLHNIPSENGSYKRGSQSKSQLFGIQHGTPTDLKTFAPIRTIAVDESEEKVANNYLGARLPVGPGQPEMQAFQSVGASNMVDLFTGDFSYNIPLLDVGGYPVNIAYRGGITMDQESSWVGLGWNINPGTISRNLRGLPDDFNGIDTVKKTTSIKPNKTIGVTVGYEKEIVGKPNKKTDTSKGTVGTTLGVFHNNYKGWGLETGLNVSINAGAKGAGALTGGLSLTNNSQEGISITPSLSAKLRISEEDNKDATTSSLSLALPYSTRSGLKGLQMGIGVKQNITISKNVQYSQYGGINSFISFASPSYTPSINIPYTSSQFSFTAKIGKNHKKVSHPNYSISGYVAKQKIANTDMTQALPAYGYLNFQNSPTDGRALLDFNREKELPYREKPATPHIAMPSYTYDIFSITGEGTGGMFRAYRGDIGFVYDHMMRTKDESNGVSIDIGFPDIVHAGIDINTNRSFTQSGPWLEQNALKSVIGFQKNHLSYEAVYFRNPGEKAINSKSFYNAIGGDDVITASLFQSGSSDPSILASAGFRRYNNKKYVGYLPAIKDSLQRKQRDKRTQVINYLNAEEASTLGLSKYIEIYGLNSFPVTKCFQPMASVMGTGTGLKMEHFWNYTLTPPPSSPSALKGNINIPPTSFNSSKLSTRWSGKIEAPLTGRYEFRIYHDDIFKLTINDSVVYSTWNGPRGGWSPASFISLNLVAAERYEIKAELSNTGKGNWGAKLEWKLPGSSNFAIVPTTHLYPPGAEAETIVNGNVTLEKRVNVFRKKTHISEINVLNPDGRTYVYGIPVYNLKQKEATFAVESSKSNAITGMVKYTDGQENSVNNSSGKDNYYSAEELPAYAHSYLLTGIVSPDYSDLTGDGITDDDNGDAIRFNYTRVAGISNPYKWKAPYNDSATYNEGLKSYNRDDKGSYVYGEKELWYLNSIESKNMLAVFVLENRFDGVEIGESGTKYGTSVAKRLKEIKLFSKADYLKDPLSAVPIKTVHFEYSYELCKGINKPVNDSGKLTLKTIWFSYNGNEKGKLNPYSFKYHSNNPTYNSKSFDRWGNYKNPSQNPGAIPNAEYPYSLQGYTAQDSINANTNAAAWTLNEIKLPSGGVIKVDYESDDYAYVQNRRAMQMFQIEGFGSSNDYWSKTSSLYTLGGDNLYVFIKVPVSPSNKSDAYAKYLEGIKKIYFRIAVQMPSDQWGSGIEYVPCYADLDIKSATDHSYYDKVSGQSVIWVKLKGIHNDGTEGGPHSPMRKAAMQFLKLNLPSKAYPGSETADHLDLAGAVKILYSQIDNILDLYLSFDNVAKIKGWAKVVNLSKSFVRLNTPTYKKRGGGYRVRRITISDNWQVMTGGSSGQKESSYGQEYIYTTVKEINGKKTTISSGVATYEPSVGNEENPFRLPIEYVERVAPLGPITLGYTEEPLGEALFPSPSVGYSKVRVRSINVKNKKSANGYEESEFYTAYDFPTLVDRSMIDDFTKKRFKPALSNFLRINAKHYMTISQGFKVELNDMHGKLKSQATYPETNADQPITYTANFYRVDTLNADGKRISNTAFVIRPDGTIDTSALIGKDVEIMVDMREQRTIVNGTSFNANVDFFKVDAVPTPIPVIIPSFYGFPQREETQFRSVATTKVIQRFGILDSVIHIDKGSKVSTKNILYESETGDVLLTRTQNEFNDPVYNFSYPAHWAYEGMGLAYKNINISLSHLNIKNGKITSGLGVADTTYFTSGDEVMVASKPKTGDSSVCIEYYATFPVAKQRLWVINKNIVTGGAQSLYFIDKDGKAFSGNDISLRIIRSGRRNMGGVVGSVTTMVNPIVKVGSDYQLQFDVSKKVISASAAEFKELWKVADKKNSTRVISCVSDASCVNSDTCVCSCIKTLFDYLLYSERLGIIQSDNINVRQIVLDAISSGFAVDSSCSILKNNINDLFYTTTPEYLLGNTIVVPPNSAYTAVIGGCLISFKGVDGILETQLDQLYSKPCSGNIVEYTSVAPVDTCRDYTISHYPDNEWLYWVIGYRDCQGYVRSISFNQSDSVVKLCALNLLFTINTDSLSQSVPTWVSVSNSLSDSCVFDSLNYYRPTVATLQVESCSSISCDTIQSGYCYSTITDTLVNPYVYGILGNFKPSKSYTYYSERGQSNPSATTNIKTDGAFADFASFWNFQGQGIQPPYNASKWVWNSEMTLFNRKGFELENKDPLGRFNSGIYGYGAALPVAIAQNSRYREVAFEGFEDYSYGTNKCDTLCPVGRHFDLSAFKIFIDSTEKHTGKYSLRVNSGDTISFSSAVSDDSFTDPPLNFTLNNDSCLSNYLTSIKSNQNAIIPTFSPINNKRVVISMWVKESSDCKCESYTGNKILVNVIRSNGTSSYPFTPEGAIIEGWQRYEAVVALPSTTLNLSVSLISTGTSAVYFDDIRIHPFNANMKSFIYHPLNLRLMAELDENNYATFFEYDDDGTLIRVKKETARGIKTIKETRTGLLKDN